MFIRKIPFFIAISALTISALAQTTSRFSSLTLSGSAGGTRSFTLGERHLSTTPVGTLYANSAFAHGYRHGYDEGFHIGDLDLQMGRNPVRFERRKNQQTAHDFDLLFSNKRLFQQGYQAGFQSGYKDAISGSPFRATSRATAAAESLNEILIPNLRQYFDEGFAGGYLSAQSIRAPRAHITAEYVEQYCRNESSSHPLEYCSGFSRGYLFAVADSPTPANKSTASSAADH